MGSVSSKGRVFGTGSRGDRRNKNFLAGVHEMEEKESLRYSYDKPKRREVVLAAFDPNSADSIEFLTWIASFYCTYYFAIPESRR